MVLNATFNKIAVISWWSGSCDRGGQFYWWRKNLLKKNKFHLL